TDLLRSLCEISRRDDSIKHQPLDGLSGRRKKWRLRWRSSSAAANLPDPPGPAKVRYCAINQLALFVVAGCDEDDCVVWRNLRQRVHQRLRWTRDLQRLQEMIGRVVNAARGLQSQCARKNGFKTIRQREPQCSAWPQRECSRDEKECGYDCDDPVF